jgi:predicted hydrocarbon binding protein
MKGIINRGIQELVESKFGAEAWNRVKELAKCEEPFFSIGEDYPDRMTMALANAASDVFGLPLEAVLVEFGEFWIQNTCAEFYTPLFKLAGNTARELLLNMNEVHRQVLKNIPNSMPPHFECEELQDGRLLIHYTSKRRLCAAMRGLVLGVGKYFDEELQVEETECMHHGAPRCTIEVTFP